MANNRSRREREKGRRLFQCPPHINHYVMHNALRKYKCWWGHMKSSSLKEVSINMVIYISTYLHLWKAYYQNTFEIGISTGSSFSEMALNSFWKRALHVYVSTDYPPNHCIAGVVPHHQLSRSSVLSDVPHIQLFVCTDKLCIYIYIYIHTHSLTCSL